MHIDYKKYHVLTSIVLCIVVLAVIFTTYNPFILFSIFALSFYIFLTSYSLKKLKKGFIYFIPFFIITILINMIFVQEGGTVIFTVLNKRVTMESLIFSFISSFKLLLVIYVFMFLEIMVDSDRAVSYFSSKMPKSTLLVMITLKLFPGMKERLTNLKEIYSIRGVDFEGDKISDKAKSSIPILSILLESSLEDSFDIGEAAYVRGFLSAKRSIYDRQKIKKNDKRMLALYAGLFICFVVMEIFKLDNFDVYTLMTIKSLFNVESIVISIFVLALCLILTLD